MEQSSRGVAQRVSPDSHTYEGAPFGQHVWLAPVLIAALALCVNLAGNSGTGLWDRDEPRYAVAVREMRAAGNWLVPTFNGQPRYHKPILTYWLMGLGTWLAGDNPFGARLASSFAGAGTCVLTWLLASRMLGSRAGWIAGLMFAVAPIAVAESKLATTDATLAFLLVGSQCCLWELSRQPSRIAAGAFWALLGLAFLNKGPVAPILVMAAAGLAWWWGWPALLAWKRIRPRAGLLVFLLLTAPWYLAVSIVTRGEFVRFAVGTQIVQRVTTGMEEHGGFPGYYASLAIPAFYPWSAFLPVALVAAWRRRKGHPELAFLLGWIVGPWIFLECLQTRLIHYYLPAFPAWAVLVAWLVEAVTAEDAALRRWPLGRLAMGLLGGIGIALTVLLMAAAIMAPAVLRPPLGLLAFVLGVGTPAAMLSLHRAATRRGMLVLGTTWGAFMLVLGGWLIPAAEPYRTSRNIGERLARLAERHGEEPVSLNYQEPGMVYAMGRPVPNVGDFGGVSRLLDRKPSFLSVVTPAEAREYRQRLGLEVTPVDELESFSLTKGRKESVQFAIIRRGGPPALADKSESDLVEKTTSTRR